MCVICLFSRARSVCVCVWGESGWRWGRGGEGEYYEMNDLAPGVTEYYGLCDSQRIIQVTKSVKLPIFLFYGDEKLFDTF